MKNLGICTLLGLATLALHGQGGSDKSEVYWRIDPMRGPVDLGSVRIEMLMDVNRADQRSVRQPPLLTHPGNIPQLPEAARLGAFIEVNVSGI